MSGRNQREQFIQELGRTESLFVWHFVHKKSRAVQIEWVTMTGFIMSGMLANYSMLKQFVVLPFKHSTLLRRATLPERTKASTARSRNLQALRKRSVSLWEGARMVFP